MSMKKAVVFLSLVVACIGALYAQGRTITFTSVTDAKFFVYLNGRLQNQRSTGMITLRDLEDKEYHVRIVIDDPFEVATTMRIRPDEKGCEYTVRFNAVRERVYLKKSDSRRSNDEESSWVQESQGSAADSPQETSSPRKRTSVRRTGSQDTATERVINTLKMKIDNQ